MVFLAGILDSRNFMTNLERVIFPHQVGNSNIPVKDFTVESLIEAPTRSTDLLSAVWRHRYKVLLTFGTIVLATTVLTAISQKQYVSEAKLQVQIGRDSVALDPTATIGPFVGIADSRETEIQAIEELILSQPVLERVLDQVGLDNILGEEKWYASAQMEWLDDWNVNPFRVYDRQAKAIKALRKDIEIAVPKSSKIITIAYETDDPELAKQLVQVLVTSTIDEHLTVNHNKNSQDFFAHEASQQQKRLSNLEEELAELKTSTGLSSVADQRKLQLEQLARLEDDLSRMRAKRISTEAEIAAREGALADLPTTVVTSEVQGNPNNPEDVMRADLFRLELREKELAARFSEDNDQLIQVRDQIRLAKAVIDSEDRKRQVTTGLNDGRQQYEAVLRERIAEHVALKAQVEQLAADRQAAIERLHAINNDEIKIKELEREIDLADAAYRRYKDSFEVTRIDEQRQREKISNIRVLQEPTLSYQPSRPKYTLNAAIGLMLAALSSIAVVVWSEKKRESRLPALISPEPTPLPNRPLRRGLEAAGTTSP